MFRSPLLMVVCGTIMVAMVATMAKCDDLATTDQLEKFLKSGYDQIVNKIFLRAPDYSEYLDHDINGIKPFDTIHEVYELVKAQNEVESGEFMRSEMEATEEEERDESEYLKSVVDGIKRVYAGSNIAGGVMSDSDLAKLSQLHALIDYKHHPLMATTPKRDYLDQLEAFLKSGCDQITNKVFLRAPDYREYLEDDINGINAYDTIFDVYDLVKAQKDVESGKVVRSEAGDVQDEKEYLKSVVDGIRRVYAGSNIAGGVMNEDDLAKISQLHALIDHKRYPLKAE